MSLSSTQHIPSEILHQIFQPYKAQKKTLLIFSTVCKSWREPALQLYYYTLLAAVPQPNKLVQALTQADNGHYVHRLILRYGACKLNEQDFLKLISYLPHLQEIDLRWGYEAYYLSLLIKMKDKISPYVHSLQVTKSILESDNYKLYFECAYHFRHTLKHLYLCRADAIYDPEKLAGSSLLCTFKQLTRLSITNGTQYGDQHLTIQHVLQACPNLLSLSLVSTHEEPLQQELNIDMKPKQQSSLKSIDLTVPNFNRFQMYYLINNYTELDCFHLFINQKDAGKWIEEMDTEALRDFGRYLGNINNVKLRVHLAREQREEEQLPEALLLTMSLDGYDTMDRYTPFLDAIIGPVQPSGCHIHVVIAPLGQHGHTTYVDIERITNTVSLTYHLDISEFQRRLDFTQNTSPHLMLSSNNINPETVTSITIEDRCRYVSQDTYSHILKSIVETYLHLQIFTLHVCDFDGTSHRTLKLGSVPEDCNILVSNNRGRISRFGYVQLRDYAFDYWFNILLDTLLNPIQVLKVVNCDFNDDYWTNNVTLDLGTHYYISQLVLDIGPILSEYVHHIFVEYISISGTAYYKAKTDPSYKDNDVKFRLLKPLKFVPVGKRSLYFYFNYRTRYNCPMCRVVTIKCFKVDEISICLQHDSVAATIRTDDKQKIKLIDRFC